MSAIKSYPCDVCSTNQPLSIDVAKIYTNNQNLYTCGNCGFVYVKDRRSSEEIAKSWSEELFQKGYTAKIPYLLARQTYVADFIDVNIGLGKKRICDIGAGEGQFLEICRDKSNNVRVFGIEPSTYNIGLLEKQNIPAFSGTIEQYRKSDVFKPKQFDMITIMWTLEACLDCNEMLKTAWEMLDDNGHIVIATGSRILVPFKKPLNNYLSANPADTHALRFSKNSLTNILNKHGFNDIILNRYIDGEFLVAIGKKSEIKTNKVNKDDPKMVIDFFNRWHADTEWLKKNDLLGVV